MSGSRVVFEGLEEFKRALRQLPEDLTAEAGRIVHGAANGAASAFMRRSGSRRVVNGVKVTHEGDAFAAVSRIRVDARGGHTAKGNRVDLAKVLEYGTGTRKTTRGANRGSGPAGDQFVPAVVEARALMYRQLRDLVRRAGFRVME